MYKIKKWNKSIYFSRDLPISFNDYYSHLENISSFWYKQMPQKTMWIDLNQSDEELQMSYKYTLRYDIKQAQKVDFKIKQSAYNKDAIRVFQKIAEAHPDLVPYPEWLLKEQKGKYYTSIYHPKYGCVAAHLHIYDESEKMGLLLINASDYRSYDDKSVQAEIGLANKLLFHSDFLFFKQKGAVRYDMGGYTPATKNFKKFFGGEVVKIYNYEAYPLYWIRQVKRKLL